jgi:indolepyruvate ferredoxin oxidoreductase beta subunit
MKYDIILSGVGGQGILSVAAVIATAAMNEGYRVRQSEVHGMAQRGGAVQAHLRISDGNIPSDLIGRGRADMILSMEPLESLRYLDYLKPDGRLVSASEAFTNIPDYPDENGIHRAISKVANSRLIATKDLAKQAGSIRAANMVLIGAAAPYLPLKPEAIQKAVADLFMRKGKETVDINLKALEMGRAA